MQKHLRSTKGILLLLVLVVALGLIGCGQKDKVEVFNFKSQLGDFTVDVPVVYTESGKEDNQGFLMTTLSTEQGKQIRILEEKTPGYQVDDAYFEEELTVATELHVERTEKLDMETFGMVYGALIEDHTLNQYMFYYKFNVGDNVATILFSQSEAISEIDEKNIKAIISSLKRIEN